MPPLTRWYLKSSLVYLVAALVLILVQSAAGVFDLRLPAGLTPVYFHLLLVGWITQLIFGVVFWMFPKYSMQQPRRSEPLGWVSFWLLNLGLLLRVVAEPLQANQPGSFWGIGLAVSALTQWLAGLAFVWNTWSRIKEK